MGSYRLSQGQERVYLAEEISGHKGLYDIPLVCAFRGALDGQILHQALSVLVQRHPILRRVVVARDDGYFFEAKDGDAIDFSELDSRVLNQKISDERANVQHVIAAIDPIDVRSYPTVRARIVHTDKHCGYLCLVFHHLHVDGYSIGIIRDDLYSIYNDIKQSGEASDNPNAKDTDLSLQQIHQYSPQSDHKKNVEFWQEYLNGLPIKRLLRAQNTQSVAERSVGVVHQRLTSSMVIKLKGELSKLRVSPFVAYLGAIALNIARYSGENDMVVVVPYAGRDDEHLEKKVGMFVDLLPIRITCNFQSSLRSFLSGIADSLSTVIERRDTGGVDKFSMLMDQGLPEETRFLPLIVNLAPIHGAPFSLPGIELERVSVPCRAPRYDIGFEILPEGAIVELISEFCRERYSESFVQKILSDISCTLEEISRGDFEQHLETLVTRTISGVALSGEVVSLNSDCMSIFELITQNEKKSPHALAILEGDKKYSYKQFRELIDKRAATLTLAGFYAGNGIAVIADPSFDMLSWYLAAISLGGTILALDSDTPVKRKAAILDNAEPRFILENGSICETSYTNASPGKYTPPSTSDERGIASSSGCRFLVYTSGSSGEPKGVLIPERAILNRLGWMLAKYPFTAYDRCVAKTKLSFVDSIAELLMPLVGGVPLVIANGDQRLNARALLELVAREEVSRLVAVPSLLTEVLYEWKKLGPLIQARVADLLILIVSSGEPLPSKLAQMMIACFPRCRVLNIYGATETGADSTSFEITKNSGLLNEFCPAGKPIWNTHCLILDENLKTLPISAEGMLYIGGAGLADGYWCDASLTQDKFRSIPGRTGRYYCTGDRAYSTESGDIVICGRADRQIKVRGQRVNLVEIEACFNQHEGVDQAVVLAEKRENIITVIAILKLSSELYLEDLREWIDQILPRAFHPNEIRMIDSIPLLPNGKIDRAQIAESSKPLKQSARSSLHEDRALSPTEERISELWKELLGRPSIPIDTNFFELGGNSLILVRSFNRLQRYFSSLRTVVDLFRYPTVRQLADYIDRSGVDNIHKANGLSEAQELSRGDI